MSGVELSIAVEGAAEVERQLAGMLGRLHDLTPLMDILGTTLESDIADNFEGEHSPEGVPWIPSKRVAQTAVGKSGPQLPTGKTLQKSRRLSLSITHTPGPRHVEVGTNVVYGGIHQFGFDGPQKVASHQRTMREAFGVKLASPIDVTVGAFTRHMRMPARPFIGASAGAREEMLAHAGAYVVGHP